MLGRHSPVHVPQCRGGRPALPDNLPDRRDHPPPPVDAPPCRPDSGRRPRPVLPYVRPFPARHLRREGRPDPPVLPERPRAVPCNPLPGLGLRLPVRRGPADRFPHKPDNRPVPPLRDNPLDRLLRDNRRDRLNPGKRHVLPSRRRVRLPPRRRHARTILPWRMNCRRLCSRFARFFPTLGDRRALPPRDGPFMAKSQNQPQFRLPFEKPVYELEERLAALEAEAEKTPSSEIQEQVRSLRLEISRTKRELFDTLDPWDVVKVARHPERPQTQDYVELVFDEFVELHGDRAFGDDNAILTGFAKLDDRKVLFVGQQKGRNLKERVECNFGMPHPEGYRKALAKMQLAAKYKLPIITFIDTPGAYPGVGAEERGQAYTIAYNLREMSRVDTPIVCVVIGEGGSGGALGIGIGDHVAVLQNAYYSVISPEGCAGILWKDNKHADQAARALKFTSKDLLRLGVVDEVVPEPPGGAHRDHRLMAMYLKGSLTKALRDLSAIPAGQLLDRRYDKFRRIGVFETLIEGVATQTA